MKPVNLPNRKIDFNYFSGKSNDNGASIRSTHTNSGLVRALDTIFKTFVIFVLSK